MDTIAAFEHCNDVNHVIHTSYWVAGIELNDGGARLARDPAHSSRVFWACKQVAA